MKTLPALRHLLAVAACLLAVAPAWAQPSIASADYRLGARDQVKIEVFEVPELNSQLRVADDGTINVPVVGAVPAAGLTVGELAEALKSRLEADYVTRASVRVELTEVLSKTVTVLGAVNRPGTQGHPGDWTLLEAITAAGGLASGHGSRVLVQRRAGNGLADQVAIRLEDLVERVDPRVNLPLLPGDLVNVERTRQITIYLLGEIASAGEMKFDSDDRVTLLTVVARAGGLTDRASPRISIKRHGDDGRITEVEVHYNRILNGRDRDVELEDGDLVVVKESFF